MQKQIGLLVRGLLILGVVPAARAQYVPIVPVVGLVQMIAADNAARKALAARTTATAVYRGEHFLLKRTPPDLLTGDAAGRIGELEAQLALCHAALLADSITTTCPPERQAAIRSGIKYIDQARPGWDQRPYHQEFRFYLAEDTRRRKAAKTAERG